MTIEADSLPRIHRWVWTKTEIIDFSIMQDGSFDLAHAPTEGYCRICKTQYEEEPFPEKPCRGTPN